jgi:hypothetical protein
MDAAELLTYPEPTMPAPIPLPNILPKVEALTPEMLPEAIREYIFDVADRQQSPPDFVAVAAICGLAALVGRKVLIRPKQLDTECCRKSGNCSRLALGCLLKKPC